MESEPTINSSFTTHVFNFDEDSKNQLIFILKYILLAVIPLVILNKTIHSIFPNVNKKKGSLEISAEVLGQLVVIFITLFFIHRCITYFLNESGNAITSLNFPTLIVAFLTITASLKTHMVGGKLNILVSRAYELWTGKTSNTINKGDKSVVRVMQPLTLPTPPSHQPSRADYVGSHEQMLPPPQPTQQQQPQQPSQPSVPSQPISNELSSQQKNFGYMYDNKGQNNALQEPMAANEVLNGFTSF